MLNIFKIRIMNKKVVFIAFTAIAGLIISSCEKDEEVPKPVIESIEFGSGHENPNNHAAYAGGDMHIEAKIKAEEKVDYINVEIHPEGEHEHEGEHGEWAYDSTFTEGFRGVIDPTFHKHIQIGDQAVPGHYHFHFTVTDMVGNQVSYEEELEILETESNIEVSNLSINGGEHDVSKTDGSFIISFNASATEGTLAKYSIEVHNHPESGNEEDEVKLMDSEFTDGFNGLTSASASQAVSVDASAPLGEYHVEIVILDSEENEKVVSGHIDLIE
jgi:type 1 fimbria pilin